MARKGYVGVGDSARRLRRAYIGIDGKARKVKKIYLGVNGLSQLVCEHRALYSITYNANGGSGSMASQVIEGFYQPSESATVTLRPNAFTRPGYVFLGWNTSSSGQGGTIYKDKQTTVVSGNLTLYAIWVQTFSFYYYKTRTVNAGGVENIAQYFSDVFEAGPTHLLACSITIPDWIAAYGYSWDTNVNTSMKFGNSKTHTVPVGAKIAFWAKNHFVGSSSIGAYNHCDIIRNGSSMSGGTEVYWEFYPTANIEVNFEWEAAGQPWLETTWPTTIRYGSSWWDIYITG